MLKFTSGLTSFLIVAYAFSLSLPITIPWVILIAGLAVMVIQLVVEFVSIGKTNGRSFTPPLQWSLLIFAGAVFISGLINGGMPEAIKSVCSLRGYLVYFWAFWAFQNHFKLKGMAVAALLAVGAVAGLLATLEQLTGFHPFSFPYLQGTGFLSAPMAFSGLAQILSLLAVGIALKRGYKGYPALMLVLICNWLGLIFCAERSAWLGAIVALFITCLLISRRAAFYSATAIALSTVIAWLTLSVVRDRLSSLLDWQHDVSVSTRFTIWQKAWETFQHSPIFGVGIRQFPHMYIPEALQQGHVALDHAHSNYLHILATTGIIGFLAYLYLLFSALKLSFSEQKDPKHNLLDQGISLGIFAGLVSLAVSGLFEYNFGTAQVRLALWFLLAIL